MLRAVYNAARKQGGAMAYDGADRSYYKYVSHGGWGFPYFLGFLGAAVYYIQQAPTLSGDLLGLLKALVWPAFLVYHLLGL